MKKIILTLSLMVSLVALGQQTPQFNLFLFNKQMINPAYVGAKNTLSFNADYRWQWTGFGDGNPETFNFGVHTPIMRGAEVSRSSVGLLFFHDQIGFNVNNQVALQYAYRVRVGEASTLSFALEANGLFSNVDFNRFNSSNIPDSDPTLNRAEGNSFNPNAGAGVYLSGAKYYVGASVSNLLENELADDDNNYEPVRHYFAHAGYMFTLTSDLKLKANVFGKFLESDFTGDSDLSGDANLSLVFQDRFLLGGSIRSDKTFTALAHVQVTRNLNIGYGYDFKSGNYGQVAGNSHEIFVGFDLGKKDAKFSSPRFVTYF